MDTDTQLKVIGGLLGLWGLVRLAGAAMVLTSSSMRASMLLIAADVLAGIVLLIGSAGAFMKEKFGFYAGLAGIALVLALNVYSFATASGGNIIAILIVAIIGYYLYDSQEAFE